MPLILRYGGKIGVIHNCEFAFGKWDFSHNVAQFNLPSCFLQGTVLPWYLAAAQGWYPSQSLLATWTPSCSAAAIAALLRRGPRVVRVALLPQSECDAVRVPLLPVGSYYVVVPDAPRAARGHILVHGAWTRAPTTGTVVAWGPDTTELRNGDVVAWRSHAGTAVTVGDSNWLLLKEEDIVCRLEPV